MIFQGEYDYPGPYNHPAKCHLEIHANGSRRIIIARDIEGNHSYTVSNCADLIATAVQKEYNFDPNDMIFFEHFEGKQCGEYFERYDLITFDFNGMKFSNPRWRGVWKESITNIIIGKGAIQSV